MNDAPAHHSWSVISLEGVALSPGWRLRLCALTLLLLTSLTSGAQTPPPLVANKAEATTRAKSLFHRGEVHFGLGQYQTALELYQRAFHLRPLPGFHFNIGQCYRNLGQHQRALFHYRQYLQLRPHAGNRALVLEVIQLSQAALGRKDAPPTTTARTATPAAATPPENGPPLRPPAPTEDAAPPASASQGQRSGLRQRWFWTAVGLTAALTVVGTITGAVALTKNKEYRDPNTARDRRQELRDSGQALQTASSVSWGLAIGSAIGSAALFWFTDFDQPALEVAITPRGHDGVWLSWARAF